MPLPQTIVTCLLRRVKQRLSLLPLSFFKKIEHSFFTLLIRFAHSPLTKHSRQATMEEPTPSTSQTDIFNSLSLSSKLEDKWPSLSITASSIQPAQKAPSMPASWTAQTTKKNPPQDHMKNRENIPNTFRATKFCPYLSWYRKYSQKQFHLWSQT